jgi:hypothetical protein
MSDEPRCEECGGPRTLPRILYYDQDNPLECTNAFHKTEAPVLEFPSQEPPAQAPPEPPAVPAKEVVRPICPHCGCDGKIRGSMTNLGPIKVMAVICSECHKYIGFFQPLGLELVQPASGVPN